MYTLNEKVSDDAGRYFRVFCASRTLTNSQALEHIFNKLPDLQQRGLI